METNTQTTLTASELRANIDELNQSILENRMMEGFDRFYADNVVQQENEQEPVVGKEANRTRELEWLDNVTEFRGAEVKSVAVDEENQITMVEWFLDYTHREWGDVTTHQVSRQQWDGGQIVHERFYYDN